MGIHEAREESRMFPRFLQGRKGAGFMGVRATLDFLPLLTL